MHFLVPKAYTELALAAVNEETFLHKKAQLLYREASSADADMPTWFTEVLQIYPLTWLANNTLSLARIQLRLRKSLQEGKRV
jgi:hypothetical protein